MILEMKLPENVKKIVDALIENGYEAYAVGGCVRDSLLNRTPKDWDITTSALPEQVKEIFPHTVDTGIKHGTVTVMLNRVGYEVTTYRIDGKYEDMRHPSEVSFTKSLSEDLLRRDFTINAMAYNEKDGLVDLFGGQEDLKNGIIRCVGDPGARFDEDALRILRAFRFSAQLGFTVEKDTKNAAAARVQNLQKVSAERIRDELCKLILSKNPDRLFDAMDAGVTAVVLPEFDTLVRGGQDAKGLKGVLSGNASSGMRAVKAVSLAGNKDLTDLKDLTAKEELILKWAALLSEYADTDVFKEDIENFTEERGGEKPEDKYRAVSLTGQSEAAEEKKRTGIRNVMNRFKFDNETRDMVVRLVGLHNKKPVFVNDVSMRQLLRRNGEETVKLLFELQSAQCLAESFVSVGGINVGSVKTLEKIKKAKETVKTVIERGDCYSIRQLAVNGRDLIEAGIDEGSKVGETLEFLLDKVIADQSLNDREKLINIACLNY